MHKMGAADMNRSSAASIADTLWAATCDEPPVAAAPLAGEADADVVVIGGGFTGCAAALGLAGAGARTVLLEAREIGWGAAGRNGGQVIPGLKLDPSELRATFGEQTGGELTRQAGSAADLVFDLVQRHQIRCAPHRAGWIQAAHSPQALERVLRRAREWEQEGAPVELLDAEQLRRRTGAEGYVGGWRDQRAGTLQPLAYARGLARAATATGATLHEASPVQHLGREDDRWRLATPGGSIRAGAVLLCTDAYSDALLPGLAQSFLTVQSVQVATEILAGRDAAEILPGGECLSETRRLAFYFRRSPDGRLVFGGRGAIGDRQRLVRFDGLERAMRRTLPASAPLRIEYRWSGQVGLIPSPAEADSGGGFPNRLHSDSRMAKRRVRHGRHPAPS